MNIEQDFAAPAPPARPPLDWPPADPSPEAVVAMPAARRRFLPRSLTARLVAGVVVLVVVVVLAVGSGTYFALRSFLYNRLDQQVAAVAEQNVAFIQRCLSQGRCPLGDGPSPTQLEWIAVLSRDGTIQVTVSSGTNLRALKLSSAESEMFLGGDSAMHTVYDGGERLRVTARAGSPQFVVVSGLSTDEVTKTLGHLIVLELLIGAAAVVVALGATTWGVRFSLRRLHEVTDTAQEVAAELSPTGAGLDRRVVVDEEGTEVGRLATSMNTLLSTVETQFAARLRSEERMRQFLADASHELRTPLTSIRGYAELARMQRAQGDEESVSDNLERIESEGTRMSRLVEDLLTLARGDQGSVPEMAPVAVDELLEDVVAGSRAAFPQRTIDLGPSTGLTAVADHDQLLRAVRNLVGNAATHTDPMGAIHVRAFPAGPGVAIQVLDQGPGLPPEEAAHVFERFWRADRARSRARGGSGLGLAIVATIVQQHGGTVQFQSTVEDGSTVTIWLPARTG